MSSSFLNRSKTFIERTLSTSNIKLSNLLGYSSRLSALPKTPSRPIDTKAYTLYSNIEISF